MPLPALIPAALSIIGSLAPSIVSSIAGAKSEDEARMALKPKMEAMRAQLVGRGVPSNQVDEQVSEAFRGIIQDEMQKGALPGWAELLLGVAGGGAGYVAGKAIAKGGKAAAKAASKKADAPKSGVKTAASEAGRTKGELPAVEDPPQGLMTPFGPRPPRGTPLDEGDLMPQPSMSARTGVDEIDAELAEAGALMRPFARY